MNLCRACGEDFSSIANFDLHRVGKHEYTYSEGIKFEPMVEDGRRCLSVDELQMRGLSRDKYGRWWDPSQSADARLLAMQKRTGASL